MTATCSHLDTIHFAELPESIAGCEECNDIAFVLAR